MLESCKGGRGMKKPGAACIWIERKKPKGGVLSEDQKNFWTR
jgi:hypothetical protein